MPPKVTDAEYIELMNFLFEKTKNAKSPLNIKQLATEFKEKSGCSQAIPSLVNRIKTLRGKVAESDTINSPKKVKIIFALSAPIDENLLKGLQKDADVEIDENNRITKYKAKNGSLELTGDQSRSARNKDGWKNRKRESFVDIFQDSMSTTPGSVKRSKDYAPDDSEEILVNPEIQSLRQPELQGAKDRKTKRLKNRKNDPEYVELMNFLIERTTNAKSPMRISQLAREFKEKSGCSQAIPSLTERIRFLRGKIAESGTIDATTKVRMIFALSAPINMSYLKELQTVADVEIDGNNRITKYREKYGNFILEGDHSASAKHKRVGEMDPIDTETKVKMIVAMGVSVDEHLLNELRTKAHVEVDGNNRITKYRAKDGSIELTGDHSHSAKMMSTTPGSMKSSVVEVPNSFERTEVKSEDFAPSDFEGVSEFRAREPEPLLLRQSKLEEDPGAEEAPILRSGGAPRASGASAPKSEATDAYTPQIKFLESIQFLILNLDTPSLSPLKTKIDEKLRDSSPNAKIANDEMKLAMELLATKIANHSMPILTENVESVSLKVFMCFLQAAILHSKLEGLEALLEKINGRINEPASKDKNIPIDKVITVLQHTLDGI